VTSEQCPAEQEAWVAAWKAIRAEGRRVGVRVRSTAKERWKSSELVEGDVSDLNRSHGWERSDQSMLPSTDLEHADGVEGEIFDE
jgi:hypothetical protein